MPTSTPADLHARADAIWRSTRPDDAGAEMYAATACAVLDGVAVPSKRAANWILTLHRYEDYWQRRGHAPRENTRARHTLSADERRLGEWGRYQRRFEDRLNAYQHARLDVSPAFRWDPLERLWRERYTACVQFIRDTGELPRLNATNTSEFAMARWLGRQLHKLRSGTLDADRVRDLHRLLRRAT